MENQNQIQVNQQNNTQLAFSRLNPTYSLMVNMAKDYCSIFPNVNQQRAFSLALSFANKLSQVKTKTGKSVLESCTQESIQSTLFRVLNDDIDLSKSHGALIAYGNQLQLQMEYFGNVKLARENVPGLVDIRGVVVYKGDTIKISVKNGVKMVVDHTTNFENAKDENIIGAYASAIYTDKDGSEYIGASEIMNASELQNAWKQSQNGTSVHTKFGHEMARKTVESRCAKHLLNKLPNYKGMVVEEENNNFDDNIIDIPTTPITNGGNKQYIPQQQVVSQEELEAIPSSPLNDLKTLEDTFNKNTTPNYYQPKKEPQQYTQPTQNVVVEPTPDADGSFEVTYSSWLNDYKPTGLYKTLGYNNTTKMTRIIKIS